jgi:hypothetical protein
MVANTDQYSRLPASGAEVDRLVEVEVGDSREAAEDGGREGGAVAAEERLAGEVAGRVSAVRGRGSTARSPAAW